MLSLAPCQHKAGILQTPTRRHVPARVSSTLICSSLHLDDRAVHDIMPAEDGLSRLSRRVLFITLPMAPVLLKALKAKAEEPAFKKFVGYNMQPDLFLGQGYGLSMNQAPAYTFEYPAAWDEDEVTKTEKSTMGMDGRVLHPKRRKEKAFVVAFSGKDYADAKMVNLKQTMDAFAGGDADLRDALTNANDMQQVAAKVDGRTVYYYDIVSDKRRYLSTISIKDGTVYGLFVTAPPTAFAKDEAELRHIQKTFTLL